MSAVAKVFQNGRSQAIRIPKEFRVDTKEVSIQKDGDRLIITPIVEDKIQKMKNILESFKDFEDKELDFIEEDLPLQERDLF